MCLVNHHDLGHPVVRQDLEIQVCLSHPWVPRRQPEAALGGRGLLSFRPVQEVLHIITMNAVCKNSQSEISFNNSVCNINFISEKKKRCKEHAIYQYSKLLQYNGRMWVPILLESAIAANVRRIQYYLFTCYAMLFDILWFVKKKRIFQQSPY